MRIRQLLIATASIGLMFEGVGVASAAPLPKACVEAGVTTAAECEALMHKGKEPAAAPAEAAPATPAPASKPAPWSKKPAPAAAAPADNQPAPWSKKPAAATAPADNKPAPWGKKPAPAAEAPATAPVAKKPAPVARPAPAAPAASPSPRPPAVAPAPATTATPAGEPAAGSADHHTHRPPAPGKPPVAPVAPVAPIAPATAVPVAPAAGDAAAPGGEPRAHGGHLSKDCVAAGIRSKADCDALHANGAAGKPAPTAPAVTTPAPAPGAAPATATPLPSPGPAVPGRPGGHKPSPDAATAASPAGTPQPPAAPTTTASPAQAGPAKPALPGVAPNQVAPLFDSAKDDQTGDATTAGRPGRTRPPHQRPAVPAGPPPANDEAAQTGIRPPTIQPIDKTQGQQIDPNANQPIGLQLPPGAQVVQPSADDRFRPGGPGDRHGHRPGGPGAPPGGPDVGGGPAASPDPLGLALGAIVQIGGQMIINSPGQDQRRIAGGQGDRSDYERLPGNRYRETVTRPNGVRIVTIYDQSGDVLRRSRFGQDGRETMLAYFDARDDSDLSDWHDPGDDLPPLQSDIAPDDYVLDADQANESQVQHFFAQPPVEQVQRLYSIDEVKRSARIRDMVRRLEIGDLTFDTGAATISEDQVQNLNTVAQAMLALLQRNPAETFLIEGHTDAVGSDISNLQLSDARAATVAEILTDFYHIPPENLATQGYGERFLTVQTDGPERLNRRVTIRRITPLITVADQPY